MPSCHRIFPPYSAFTVVSVAAPQATCDYWKVTLKAAIDNEREAVLDQLAADAQDQDMGYGSK